MDRFLPNNRFVKFTCFICFFLLLFLSEKVFSQQGGISRIYTDYNGFWTSASTNNTVKPENDHNLLGFVWNGATYSTGVNDARLIANGVSFIPTVFQAFPVRNVVLSGSDCKIALGQLKDGVNNGKPATAPFTLPPKISDFLTDGINGLNIGTGVANVPESTPLTFDFGSIIDPAKINDGKPDLLVSQIASPGGVLDRIYFTDANGNRVGNIVSINQELVNAVATWTGDFYELNGNLTGSGFINSDRPIRVWAADVTVFGITLANYATVTALRYELKGSSDPAFLAFNTSIIQVLSANDDVASTDIGTTVNINVLNNDSPISTIDATSVTIITAPQHGTYTISSSGVIRYTPFAGYYGTDSFVYRVYGNDHNQYDDALVNINIGGPVAEPVFNTGLVSVRCQGAGSSTYTATAANSTSISYASSPSAAGTINTATGVVTWSASFSGTATITAVASGANGPKSSTYTVTVNSTPVAPSAQNKTICSGNTATLTATAPGGNYDWFDVANDGASLASNASFTTPSLTSNTTYYVQTTVNGCISPRTAVTVTVNAIPAAPTASDVAICSGSRATLTATAPGGNYEWFDVATGGTSLASNASFTTPNLTSNTTYYVQTTVNGCVSPRTAVTVTVNEIPAAPTASNKTICTGNTATLTASAPGGMYHWYDAASGGTLLSSDASFTTPNLTNTTTYYVDATSAAGCTGLRSAVTVTVIPPTDPEFHYSANIFCKTGTNPVPVTTSTSGGTFSASSTGLVFTDNHTGEINLSASTAGTYTITFVTNTTCVYSSSLTITITNGPDAAFSYNGTYCQQQINPLPTLPTGNTAGIFSCADAGLVFVNNSSGEINLQQSLPGTYTVRNDIAAANGCAATFATNFVTINPLPVVNAGADQIICSEQTVILNGTIAGGASSATWSGGTGTFSDPSSIQTIYTPGINETNARLILTTNDPAGPCGAVTDELSITIKPTPRITSAQSDVVCSGNPQNYTITGNVTGTTFNWSRAAKTGISNATVTGQTNSTITETLYNTTSSPITVTYTIIPEANGCTGAAFNYQVTVKPTPNITSLPATVICNQINQNYVITSDVSGATFSWNRVAVAGISNAAVTAQTSNTITEALVNTTSAPVSVTYVIIPQANGCTGDAFTYTVTVKPTPAAPTAAGTTICSGNTATLTANGSTGTYEWFDAATGGNLLSRDASFTTGFLSATTTFYVQTTVNDCISARTEVTVAVTPIPLAPVVSSNSPVCSGTSLMLATPAVTGANYSWTGPNGFVSSLQNPVIPNTTAAAQGTYSLTVTVNGCTSSAGTTNILINLKPATPSVGSNSPICAGETLQLNSSTIPDAVYSWTGPNGFVSSLQNPVIANAGVSASGNYRVTAAINGCTSMAGTVSVVINPIPAAPVAGSNSPVCATTSLNLTAAGVAGASYHWMGPNGFTSSVQNPVIPVATTANSGTYSVTVSVGGCTSAASSTTVLVTPEPAKPILSSNSPVCSGSLLQLNSSGDMEATFRWTGPNGFTSNLQNPIINQTAIENQGRYTVTVTTPNCGITHTAFIDIKINQTPVAPLVNSNSPVCIKQTLKLSAEAVAGGLYSWTGPNGFTSNLQNPEISDIKAEQAGKYLVTVTANGCTSTAASTTVIVNQPAIVFAGKDQTVCASNSVVAIAGNISGSATTGVWTTSGSGSFAAGNNSLKGNYLPSTADVASGNITLTLTAANTAAPCAVAAASFNVTFKPLPIVSAGDDQEICLNDQIALTGTIMNSDGGIWSSSGTGKFSPSNTDLNARYLPSEKDKVAGNIILTLTASGNGNCINVADQLNVRIVSPPKISAGNDIYIMEDEKLMLTPVIIGTALKYTWTPNLYLNDNTLKNPILTGNQDITYTLTVTGKTGCVAQDQVAVKVMKPIIIPNTFTPNADGINDTWVIKYLENYPNVTVKIFNRYGAQIFYSEGYGVPWDGTYNGQSLPVGAYYYLIDLKANGKFRSGPITIIR